MAIENLIENVDNQIIKIRTKSLDVSFNELFDMYENDELIISPDYQRLFRWEEEKQSRFIESLLLEMPVPPIFVIEKDDGIYELIDGLQRISSYLHFRGKSINSSQNADLVLSGCDIVTELNGNTYKDLPKALQIKLKRMFVRMEVIKKESEPSLKYHMFKRLNTGGEILSAQEIRNCTIRLLGVDFITFIEKCSNNEDFKKVTERIGSEKRNRKYDQELVLRFFAIKNNIDEYKYPVTEYLTNYLEIITTRKDLFDYKTEEEVFNKTFKFINTHFGDEAFSGKTANGTIRNEFVLYYYDGITVPIANYIKEIEDYSEKNMIKERINDIKYGDSIKAYTTGNPSSVKARINLFSEGVQEILDTK